MRDLSPWQAVRGKLVVSCQAAEGEPFHSPDAMARFALSAKAGGAAAIRANGTEDVRAIREAARLPVIGIRKRVMDDGRILITPSFEDAAALVEAGASAVALDCTARGRRSGALERLRRMRAELGAAVMADIATAEDADAAVAAGADFVLTTLRGYTDDTAGVTAFDPSFVASLASRLPVPVIAEGRIATPSQAREAIEAGAFAVVAGTAITRPHEITRAFARAVEAAADPRAVVGIDLGATRTKSGLVLPDGQVQSFRVDETPRTGAGDLIGHLASIVNARLAAAAEGGFAVAGAGIATAGWVDGASGRVLYATGNLPGWSNADIRTALRQATGLDVAVESDAHAAALAEARYGAARGVRNFILLTLGTGVGGAVFSGGRLVRGAHGLGGALGHMTVEAGGRACTCGLSGCLEQYANARAAASAPEKAVHYLTLALASLVHVFDPDLILLAGGGIDAVPALPQLLEASLRRGVFAAELRNLRVAAAATGYASGVAGAAAAFRSRQGEESS